MRIGIDAHMLGDHSGGNESYYSNILMNMNPDKEDTVYLFVKQDVEVAEYESKFKIVPFESSGAFRRNFIELPRLCKKYKLDVLHTQYFIPFYRPCEVVCTIHDICFEHYKDIFTKKEYLRQKILIPYAARHSKYIFTVSNHAKQDIVTHYGVSEDKVIVTYNSVNQRFRELSDSELEECELRAKFGIGEGRYILSVGNLQPRKNLPRLIRAFTELKKKENYQDVQLVIVGKKAWMYNDIMKEALKDADNIVFTDYVETEDLVRLYNAAHCFVYPSFFEGFGIPPLESMACGTPVAVAKATSLPEVVGEAGIYFDPFSEKEIQISMEKMLQIKGIPQELTLEMSNQVKKFSWEESAQKILSIYKKC